MAANTFRVFIQGLIEIHAEYRQFILDCEAQGRSNRAQQRAVISGVDTGTRYV
jgi:hypothetical protein